MDVRTGAWRRPGIVACHGRLYRHLGDQGLEVRRRELRRGDRLAGDQKRVSDVLRVAARDSDKLVVVRTDRIEILNRRDGVPGDDKLGRADRLDDGLPGSVLDRDGAARTARDAR